MKHLTLVLLLIGAGAVMAATVMNTIRLSPAKKAVDSDYTVEVVAPFTQVSLPDFPDITHDTVASVRAALPSAREGAVHVRPIGDLYLGLSRDLHLFAEKQQRFNPVAIVIESGVYTLEMLVAAVADPALILRNGNAYHLFVPILIEKDASLIIGDGSRLLMSVESGALMITFGRLDIVGADIAAWHFSNDTPAFFKGDRHFRPYLTALCGSRMNVAGSRLAHLGYFDTKAYGLSYSSCDDIAYEDKGANRIGGTGRVVDSHIEGLYYGFYTYESRGVRVVRNTFKDSIVYGIDPHDRSAHLMIAHNTVSGTQEKHGIIFSRDVQDSFIIGNVSTGNKRAGLILDRNSSRNVIAHNILQGNGGDGMAFYESGYNLSVGNIMAHNGGSGLRIRNSRDVISQDDVISHNRAGGVQAYAVDLVAAGAVRNLQKDPYEQAVSAAMAGTEMTGNVKADITVRDIDSLTLSSLKRFQSPRRLIAGDIVMADAPSPALILRRAY